MERSYYVKSLYVKIEKCNSVSELVSAQIRDTQTIKYAAKYFYTVAILSQYSRCTIVDAINHKTRGNNESI